MAIAVPYMTKNMRNCATNFTGKQKDEISSPLSAQILEFCESELFPATPEVGSTSNCCYEDQSSYTTTNHSFTLEVNNFPTTINNNDPTTTSAAAAAATTTANNNNNLSIIFDSPEDMENDISASIDFTTPTPPFSAPHFFNPQQEQFDFALLQAAQIPSSDHGAISQYPSPLMGPSSLPEDQEFFSSMPSYLRFNPSSSPPPSFLDPPMNSYLPTNLSTQNSGVFSAGNLFMGNELQPQEFDFQGDNDGIFCTDPLPRLYNSTELQALSNESQHLGHGGVNSTCLASEITSLEDSTFKVGKLSVEERKEKIHRYMKKRNERNFNKKIKYACRKTLADSRPRVRGRFAKNDEFGETIRTTHEEDTDEDTKSIHVAAKAVDMVDSSDIFAHISGVNSFKCNYPIQSWI